MTSDRSEIILTAGCNLRCSYCYQNDKKARSVDWDTLRASLDLALRSRHEKVNLLFIGGEPLLEFALMQRAVAYVEEAKACHKRIHYEIITNGMLLAEQHVEFFAAHDFDVQLSFDGVPAAQASGEKGFSRSSIASSTVFARTMASFFVTDSRLA